MPPSVHALQLGVGHVRMHDGDAARLRPELRERVERHRVVGVHRPPASPRRCGSFRSAAGTAGSPRRVASGCIRAPGRGGGNRAAVIDVHVAVAGVRRRLRLGALAVPAELGTCMTRIAIRPPFRPSPCYVPARMNTHFSKLLLAALAGLLIAAGAALRASPRLGHDEERGGLRPRRHGHRRAPRLDLRRHVSRPSRSQGLESKEKGEFTREELQPLAKVNVESLKEYDLLHLRQGRRQASSPSSIRTTITSSSTPRTRC